MDKYIKKELIELAAVGVYLAIVLGLASLMFGFGAGGFERSEILSKNNFYIPYGILFFVLGIVSLKVIGLLVFKSKDKQFEGTIVHDPDSDNSADKFKFAIPSDWRDYEAVVSFARPKAGYLSTTGLGGKPATGVGGPAASAVMVKDTEVGDVSRYNAVSVGGPCVNRVTASLLGVTFPACGAQSGLNSGEATLVLKDNGAKKALLVYGWDQADTARAAVLLKDPAVLKEKLNSAGKSTAESVMVRGTGMDVAAITVA